MSFGEMLYQPMLERLSYLHDEGFTTYIVSGGGIDFIRAFADQAYGIPPWQVVGTEGDTTYAADGAAPTLMKNGDITFFDDKEGRPVGVMRHISQRPIFAAGNSDGDFQMLEYTTAGDGVVSGCWSITPTRIGSLPMTGTAMSVKSPAASMKARTAAG